MRKNLLLIGTLLASALAATAGETAADDPGPHATLWLDQDAYPMLTPQGQKPLACVSFRNDGTADALHLPTPSPYRVLDARGHDTYYPSAVAVVVQVEPGATYRTCWRLASHESPLDVLAHGDAPWTLASLSGHAPPGDYRLEWTFMDGSETVHVRTLPFRVTEAIR